MNIDLSTLPRTADTPAARVWTKARWSDPFTLQPHLIPTQTSSTLAPDVSTATLENRYGHGLIPGTSHLATYAPITTWGYFVLVEWFTSQERRWWLGYAGKPVTTQTRAAAGDLPAAGTQTIPCYGLERAFELTRIASTVHADPAGDAEFIRHPTGSTFNADRFGNRHHHSGDDPPDFDLFALPRAATVHRWSSRQIVRHLLTFHLPTPNGQASGLPWTVGNLAPVPDWDEPTLATDGRTLAECLGELLSRERLLGWHIVPTIVPGLPPVVSALTVTPISRAAHAITLPALGSLPPNPHIHALTAAADPLTIAATSEDDAELVDQIIVEGPREIGVCTPIYGDLERGWTTAEQSRYEDGARPEPTWGDMPLYQQRDANERVRRDPTLARVYSSLVIRTDWDGMVDGFDRAFAPAGIDEEDEPIAYAPFVGNLQILDTLPLFEEVDYQGPLEDVDESAGRQYRRPAVMIKRPGSDPETYDLVEKIGQPAVGMAPPFAGLSFTLHAGIDNERGPGLRLYVGGGPAHAIAGDSFVGTTADADQSVYYGFSFRDVIATVALLGDRRPYHALPADSHFSDADLITRRVIRLEHPTLQHIHIAPRTVVGLDGIGQLLRSDGGILRDPSATLRALAILAAESWTKPTRRVDLQTARMLSALDVGHIIATVDGDRTAATIVEVRVDAPTADRDQVAAPVTTRITAAGQRVDIYQLLKPPPDLPPS